MLTFTIYALFFGTNDFGISKLTAVLETDIIIGNIPKVPLKHFMAAPTAVSNWITFTLLEVVFGLTITSKSRQFSFRVRLIAE